MASYTELNKDQINQILKQYGLPEALRVVPMGLGISNSNYKLEFERQAPLLLKVSNDKNLQQLQDEYRILNFLKENQYPFSLAPLKNKSSHETYSFENYHGAIFPFVEGSVERPTTATCYEIGRSIAQLHLIPIGPSGQLRTYEQIGQNWGHLCNYLKRPDCLALFREKVAQIIHFNKMEDYQNYSLPMGITHGDLYYDNVLFADGKVKVLLDFEQAGTGPLIWDLGICLSGCCWDKERNLFDIELASSLLRGYQEVRRLNQDEEKLLAESVLFGFLSVALWRIHRFVERKIDEKKKNSYLELLDRALAMKDLKWEPDLKNLTCNSLPPVRQA